MKNLKKVSVLQETLCARNCTISKMKLISIISNLLLQSWFTFLVTQGKQFDQNNFFFLRLLSVFMMFRFMHLLKLKSSYRG